MHNTDQSRTIQLVVASNNPKKAAEIRSMLPVSFIVRTAEEARINMPEETGTTFAENALLKARAAARQTGILAIADDSGLAVDALDGLPGVRSARFAADHGLPAGDSENNQLLLEMLKTVPPERRAARFVAAIAVVTPAGLEHVEEGSVEGTICCRESGTGGFGYDPLFRPVGYDKTMAQIDAEEKNRISHRGKALRKAIPQILALTTAGQHNEDNSERKVDGRR